MTARKNRPTGLSAADRDLWDHVARNIEPLKSDRYSGKEKATRMVPQKTAKAENATNMVAKEPPPGASTPRRLSAEEMARAMSEWPNAKPSRQPVEIEPSLRQNVPGLDKRSAERLRKGKMEIDGRLDLHGLTRAEAHRRLRSFITAAQIQGKRCVLVITGKGSSRQKTDDAPFMAPEKTGILREAVPKWLMAADLRHLVIDIRHAQPKHGGSGALYVLLRRSRN